MANSSKRWSTVWNHFEVKDKNNQLAECNYCLNTFSFKSTVNNLRKHLYAKHGFISPKLETDGTDCEVGEGDSEESKKIWEFFEPKEESIDVASCNLCSSEITYGADKDELWLHLRDSHEEKVDFEDEGSEAGETEYLDGPAKSELNTNTSKAWHYFTILDPISRSAQCRLCNAVLSYRTSVSNLVKHTIRKHKIDKEDGDVRDDDSTKPQHSRSIVWLYFKNVDPVSKVAQCTLCSKLFSHVTTTSNLKKHLTRKHPNVKIPKKDVDGSKRVLFAAGGELYEVQSKKENDNENELMEMDTVYLDDFQEFESSTPKKRNTEIPLHASDSSSDEEVTLSKKFVKKKHDSIDIFGRYIATLLRQLPKEISNQLQSDFVKQIMNTQLALDAKVIESNPNEASAYSITITADEKRGSVIDNENQ